MFLFLVASLPLFFFLVTLLPWGTRQAPRTLTLLSTFLKGILLFFPGYLGLLIVRRVCGFSYDGLLLFLSLLQRDHLFPLLGAVAGFLLLQRSLSIPGTDESIFLTVFACVSGFLSMMNIADWLRTWGSWDAYVLFLLPALRLAAALTVALAAQRFYRWEGRDGVLFCGAAGACAVVLTMISFLFAVSRVGLSILLCVLFAVAGTAVLAMRFPRAVRG
ncbi:MAG: hypothetical protein ABSG21_10650 [Spirochaetia bacterium]|jgi:hypothetical protein